MKRFLVVSLLAAMGAILAGCGASDRAAAASEAARTPAGDAASSYAAEHLGDYASVTLHADLSHLDAEQQQLVALLIEAADGMNAIFWRQAVADKEALLSRIDDAATRRLFDINFGPWDRLNNYHPFVAGVGERPAGSQFYPADMSKDEFANSALEDKTSLYTLLRRDDTGQLITVPYHEAYEAALEKAAGLLRRAAALAANAGFREYLELRADALLTDDFRASDMAWMNMKTNPVDIVIGPIETYEDRLYGYKASYEAYVLIKDTAWSERLERFAGYLPELQQGLPVPAAYKAETPGSDADLNAYFVVYYAGSANAGAKTIAINLPNDERVQLEKGTRRLQLENVMQAKFDKIMLPIADVLIAEDQQSNVTFDAFFENTMFHEVAHGLGIKNTLNGKGTVRKALKDYASSIEEGKADILGLYMITRLAEKGELESDRLMDNYVTFLAGIFRSVRFGAGDAHGKANMVRFNFFREHGAFSRDEASGRYRVDFERMQKAMNDLAAKLLILQGDGDYAEARRLTGTLGKVGPRLAADLERLEQADIPVDVVFEQGLDVLGLSSP